MGWRGGEESRYPGNSCCSVEQMALGGAVMAAAPGHPPQQPGRPEQTADSTHGYKRVSRAALMCSTNLPLSLSSRVSVVFSVSPVDPTLSPPDASFWHLGPARVSPKL